MRRFHHALAALIAPRLTDGSRADALAFVGLLKRSVSTICACVNTLRVVAERYAAGGGHGRQHGANGLARCAPIASDCCVSACWTNRARMHIAELEVESMAAELRDLPPSDECACDTDQAWREAAAEFDPKLAALVLRSAG